MEAVISKRFGQLGTLATRNPVPLIAQECSGIIERPLKELNHELWRKWNFAIDHKLLKCFLRLSKIYEVFFGRLAWVGNSGHLSIVSLPPQAALALSTSAVSRDTKPEYLLSLLTVCTLAWGPAPVRYSWRAKGSLENLHSKENWQNSTKAEYLLQSSVLSP